MADMFSPSNHCSKPNKPFRFTSDYEADAYNSNVKSYKYCIEEFISKQKEEIDTHRKAINDAIDEWNYFIRTER